jgi:demethylmenaquinone methyltransferase/2-methoxy-6-polyprenyl-1,4-benzoquinol methylase
MRQRPRLARAFDSPEDKRRYNARLFDTIATRYDVITRLLSYGRDQAWKRRAVAFARIAPGDRVLDLACGTGDLTVAAASHGARVVGLDLVPSMVALARQKPGASIVPFLVGDMTSLPFAGASVDVITTGYGLRNVPRIEGAIAECARVLRPGGRFVSLDFNRPSPVALRAAYLVYLTIVGSTVGLALHGDPDTYRYIPESIKRYPGAEAVVSMLERAGFARARWHPVLGGLMAIHEATR